MPDFQPLTLKNSPDMDHSPSVVEVKKPGSPPPTIYAEVDHRPHRRTGLFSAVAYCATHVLRTATTTEVVGYPNDGGDGMEPSSTNACGFSFDNMPLQVTENPMITWPPVTRTLEWSHATTGMQDGSHSHSLSPVPYDLMTTHGWNPSMIAWSLPTQILWAAAAARSGEH